MKGISLLIALLLSGCLVVPAQTSASRQKHDRATLLIGEALFDSRAKPVRDQLRAFENGTGVKLQFRVADASLDQLGGLSEHLFRLFQTFTSLSNTHAKTATAEFSLFEHPDLQTEYLHYETKTTPDLSTCMLPPKDTRRMDSVYNNTLSKSTLGDGSLAGSTPAHLDGLYSQAIHDYEEILFRNSECPGLFDANAYSIHVKNTRSERTGKWQGDVNALSLMLSTSYGLITNTVGSPGSGANSGSSGVNLNINPAVFTGSYVINLNNSVNPCTRVDMESGCRMLFAETGKRFLFITQTLDYFLPLDSMNLFRDAAAATFSNNLTDDIIIAFYLKMHDPVLNKTSATLLVKQINGTWLTAGDISFANYNTGGGDYTANTYYRYKNLYKNIPKPLVLCYQVAKVNGLLSTSYIRKAEAAKGRDQIYYHVFKIDRVFEEISQLYREIAALKQTADEKGNYDPYVRQLMSEHQDKVRHLFVRAVRKPDFVDAGVQFKEVHLQSPVKVEAAALKHLKASYGDLYGSAFNEPSPGLIMPADLLAGSCASQDESDVIADILDVSSLLLMPTGLDIIPDALSVCYFASSEQYTKMYWALGSVAAPGSMMVARRALSGAGDAVSAINKGDMLLKENGALKAASQDASQVAALFGIRPEDVSTQLLGKISANPVAVNELLTTEATASKIYGNVSDYLEAPKRLEFVNKSLDEPGFRSKVLNDPDEVLRWGGVIVRGVAKSSFMKSVPEFLSNPQLGEQAWTFFKNENWSQLENLINTHGINGGWPPNNGFIDVEKISLPVNFEVDRYGGSLNNGIFVDNGKFVAPLNASFSSRALPNSSLDQPYRKYKVVKEIPNVCRGKSIPWFEQSGQGLQFELPEKIDDLVSAGYLELIP